MNKAMIAMSWVGGGVAYARGAVLDLSVRIGAAVEGQRAAGSLMLSDRDAISRGRSDLFDIWLCLSEKERQRVKDLPLEQTAWGRSSLELVRLESAERASAWAYRRKTDGLEFLRIKLADAESSAGEL